jgi:hypothetical protein
MDARCVIHVIQVRVISRCVEGDNSISISVPQLGPHLQLPSLALLTARRPRASSPRAKLESNRLAAALSHARQLRALLAPFWRLLGNVSHLE